MEIDSEVNKILDFAISREEEAFKFYTELANKMKLPAIKQVFMEFAEEEKNHKKKLQNIKLEKSLKPNKGKVLDLQIAEYTVAEEPREDMEYRDALVLAMKKEKAAFKLYSDLATKADSELIKQTFMSLAQEEAKHKLRFEIEYESNFLTEKGY